MKQDKDEEIQATWEIKKPWEEPRLNFVEPKLIKHGNLRNITGFVGPFSP